MELKTKRRDYIPSFFLSFFYGFILHIRKYHGFILSKNENRKLKIIGGILPRTKNRGGILPRIEN